MTLCSRRWTWSGKFNVVEEHRLFHQFSLTALGHTFNFLAVGSLRLEETFKGEECCNAELGCIWTMWTCGYFTWSNQKYTILFIQLRKSCRVKYFALAGYVKIILCFGLTYFCYTVYRLNVIKRVHMHIIQAHTCYL